MMYNLNDIELIRLNVKLEKSVKEWYQYRAKSMGMTMSQLMAYVLTTYSESQKNNEAVRSLALIAADEQTTANNAEIIAALQKLSDLGEKNGNV